MAVPTFNVVGEVVPMYFNRGSRLVNILFGRWTIGFEGGGRFPTYFDLAGEEGNTYFDLRGGGKKCFNL